MATPAKTTTTTKTTTTKSEVKNVTPMFLFDRTNYTWMIAGIVLIFIGLALMAGGKSPDPHNFNYEEIYSFRRITLAPILMMIGFMIEIYAIMKKPTGRTETTDTTSV
jgi:uncharacterized membrane protein